MLPKRCRPVIVTDAGFKVPWFKEISALGWHFIGRVRGKVSVRLLQFWDSHNFQEKSGCPTSVQFN
jgi:hypothetical protein